MLDKDEGHKVRVQERLKRDVERVAILNSIIGRNRTMGGGRGGGGLRCRIFGRKWFRACNKETAVGCCGHGGGRWCKYEVSYGDGSYTKGTSALETLIFGNTFIRNVAIGCGHRNQGLFVGVAGLLGIGGGSMLLVSQLGGEAGGAFSYCLVSRGTDSSGSFEFGREAIPTDTVVWVPLLKNPRARFYYVGLSGLGVGGVQVSIPEPIFKLSDMGHGGVVMDTTTPNSCLYLIS
nr:protein aspartic protease in guard cell 2 [Tanacetum cinerariifolium]